MKLWLDTNFDLPNVDLDVWALVEADTGHEEPVIIRLQLKDIGYEDHGTRYYWEIVEPNNDQEKRLRQYLTVLMWREI